MQEVFTFQWGWANIWWWIRAWRPIGGSGMHRIDRVARIHRDNRRGLSGSAAGVVPVTTVGCAGWCYPAGSPRKLQHPSRRAVARSHASVVRVGRRDESDQLRVATPLPVASRQ